MWARSCGRRCKSLAVIVSEEDLERIVVAESDEIERAAEAALRPKTLDEFVGQKTVRDQLSLVLEAAKVRGSAPDHVLLSGPPGLGKTTLAMIIGSELSAPVRITSGPAIQHAGDLAAVLSSLEEGEVLFLDEIHRLARPAEELLYVAMEDFRVDVVVGKGAGASAIPLPLPRFTVVGATTRAGLLPAPLRDRFGFTGHMEFYEDDELQRGLMRSARLLEIELAPAGAADLEAARSALLMCGGDELGLDRLGRGVLEALGKRFAGGPVGLTTLAVAVGEEAETVETVAEPFWVREGLITRTPRGRMLSAAGWEHIGMTPPPGPGQLPLERLNEGD